MQEKILQNVYTYFDYKEMQKLELMQLLVKSVETMQISFLYSNFRTYKPTNYLLSNINCF